LAGFSGVVSQPDRVGFGEAVEGHDAVYEGVHLVERDHVGAVRGGLVGDLVGLDEARFRPISGFSTGMRQRTKLAQALVGDPVLVLLDEPTAGLDPLGREEMLELVARLGTFGISVLMATHLLDDVQQVCDYVVMIDGGRLVVAGATDSLLEQTGLVTVDVGVRTDELVAALARVGLTCEVNEGLVNVTVHDDAHMDVLRDVIADTGLPLYRLTTRLTSLDEVFLRQARVPS
jgi:ABC-2 type transport system ATP-binding protein